MIQIKNFVTPIDIYYLNKHPFPNGIQRAWSELEGSISNRSGLKFFGIFDGKDYWAGCDVSSRLQQPPERVGNYKIPAGQYLSISILNWQDKKEQIALAFQRLEEDPRSLSSAMDIEYYKSAREMICLKEMR